MTTTTTVSHPAAAEHGLTLDLQRFARPVPEAVSTAHIELDDAVKRLAVSALTSLRRLVAELEPGDLSRRAAVRPDGGADWLTTIDREARELRADLDRERHAVEAHAKARKRFDGAAMLLLTSAASQVRALEDLQKFFSTAAIPVMVETLMAAGLTEAESERLANDRHGAQIAELLERRDAEARRVEILSAFVGDPYRRLDLVPEDVRAEIETIHANPPVLDYAAMERERLQAISARFQKIKIPAPLARRA